MRSKTAPLAWSGSRTGRHGKAATVPEFLEKRPALGQPSHAAFEGLYRLDRREGKPTVEQGVTGREIEVVVVEDQRLKCVRGPFFQAQFRGASFVQDIARRSHLQIGPVRLFVLLDQVDHALDHPAHRQPFSLACRHVLSKQEPGIEQRSGVQYKGRIPLGLAEQERGVVAQPAGPDHGGNIQERGDDAQHEGKHKEDQRQQTGQVKQGADGADEQQRNQYERRLKTPLFAARLLEKGMLVRHVLCSRGLGVQCNASNGISCTTAMQTDAPPSPWAAPL